MRKLLYIFLFFVGFEALSQDTIPGDSGNFVFTNADIQIDSAAIDDKNFEQNLNQKYNGTDFTYEAKADEKTIWDRFLEWLAALLRDIFEISSTEKSIEIVVIALKVVATLIIVFVIYLLVKAILNKEGNWIFGKNLSRKIIEYDAIEKNLRTVNFEKLIVDALATGENRLVIRYYYLWLLKNLSEKGHIEWDAEKTNSDYLYEIENATLKDQFSYLSYLYNYIWYGEFAIDEQTFEKSKMAFENAIKTIR